MICVVQCTNASNGILLFKQEIVNKQIIFHIYRTCILSKKKTHMPMQHRKIYSKHTTFEFKLSYF